MATVSSKVTNLGVAVIAKRCIGTSPSQAEPLFVGIGTGATGATRTAAVTDTALTTAVGSRATGTSSTVTVTVTNDTYQVVATITASTTWAVDEAGSFDASTSGNMVTSFTFAVINLANGDSLQLTIKLTLATS